MQTAEITNKRGQRPRTLRHLLLAMAVLATAAAVHVAEPPPASAASYGVVEVCVGRSFEGPCQTFTNFVPDLGATSIGHDRASSVRVQPDTRIVLWEHANYSGRCQVFDTLTRTIPLEDASFVGSVIGDNAASSISFGWGYRCNNPSVFVELTGSTPYSEDEIYTDLRSLGGTDIGNDGATGVSAEGAPAAIYSDFDFQGSCVTVEPGTSVFLSGTYVGKFRASSIALDHRCENDLRLCEHVNLEGRCISLVWSQQNLGATDLGHDRASSIRVPDGWRVTVYEHPYYEGTPGKIPSPFLYIWFGRNGGWGDLVQNFPVEGVQNDMASSIHIERPSSCVRHHPGCLLP